jgi:hypothetical protein
MESSTNSKRKRDSSTSSIASVFHQVIAERDVEGFKELVEESEGSGRRGPPPPPYDRRDDGEARHAADWVVQGERDTDGEGCH